MAFIKPFCGIRYNTEKAGNLDDLVTPPYDVINDNARQAFFSRNPYNSIRLDLANNPAKGKSDDHGQFSEAAHLLDSWLKDGILKQDSKPAFYPYDVEFRLPDGSSRTRKGFICLAGLTEFEEQSVKPHEQIFETVTRDRLELIRQCRAQFSQVFATFSDPDNRAIRLLDRVKGDPVAEVIDADGCRHALWKVVDENTIHTLQNILAENVIYIADGHHRYTAALAYRKEQRQDTETFTADAPENFICMYLCPMEDKELTILPVHRLIRYPGTLALTGLLDQLAALFTLEEISGGSREALLSELLCVMGDYQKERIVGEPITFGFYHPGEDRCFLMTLRKEALDRLQEYHSSLRDIDAAILTCLIIQDTLKLDQQRCEHENLISFHSDLAEALDISVKQSSAGDDMTPLLFLINPTTIGQVKSVSDSGLCMPHKSSYFYPKIMTGLVMRVFDRTGTDSSGARADDE